MKLSRTPDPAPSFVEFSNPEGPVSNIDQIGQVDILQYVQEMCVTLSYMSNAKQCEALTSLLKAAAVEAQRQINAAKSSTSPLADPTLYSIARKAQ